jgi:F-type H+-transporting ATPase subunit b
MQIDWITVAAQIANFLVLVWLLQHFLYGPITRAMKRREERIAARLREAAESREKADGEARSYRDQQEELKRQREDLIAEARESAEKERRSLERTAREAVEAERQEWLHQLAEQKETFLGDLRRQASDRFYRLNRQAMAELANTELESQIVSVFIDRLHDVDKEIRGKTKEAARAAGNRVDVTSRFEMSTNDKRRLTKAIHDAISDGAEIDYRLSEEIGCGIVVKAGSQTIAWSLDGYFDSLERALAKEIGKMTGQADDEAAQ